MTYVMSDIHGCYDEYQKMLKLINFSDDDSLFVLGDVVDRGEKPIEVLRDMSMRANVFPIIGNHEYMAVGVLLQVLKEAKFILREIVITEDSSEELEELISGEIEKEEVQTLLTDMLFWEKEGGSSTLKAFGKLSQEDKEFIIDYIEEFSLYDVITINNQTYILTHSGLPEGATLENLDEYDAYDFIMTKTDYNKIYFDDAILVTGHWPVMTDEGKLSGKVWRGNNHLRIDTGCVFGGTLSCVCLDTGEEFYVESNKIV